MKNNFKYYLFYLVIFLIGASIAAGIKFAYNFSVLTELTSTVGAKLSIVKYASFTARFLTPAILTFLSSFTIYACAVGTCSSLYCGIKLGIMLITYCKSGLNPFTHAASLIFLIAFAFFYTYLSTSSALYRASLRYTAPDPREILRLKGTSALFKVFIYILLAIMAMSCALYFFIFYFPIV